MQTKKMEGDREYSHKYKLCIMKSTVTYCKQYIVCHILIVTV